MSMSRLFTYTIPIDDGAAPNPFHGMCSLAICKPGIRRAAKKGDWVAGLGSKNAKSGDLSQRLVYAMRVEEVLSLEDYDKQAPTEWLHRIPDVKSADLSKRLGDCIYYDFSKGEPMQRRSVHGPENVKLDLSGKNALLSHHYYYFGSSAIRIPDDLLPICQQNQGFKSNYNAPYFDRFVTWLHGLNLTIGQHGWPDHIVDWAAISSCGGCVVRKLDDESDEAC